MSMESNAVWVYLRSPGGVWVGVCDDLGLTMQGDTFEELQEAIAETLRLVALDQADSTEAGPCSVSDELNALGVRVRHKSESRLMCLLGFFLGARFMSHSWTTISGRTIWAPDRTRLDMLSVYAVIVRHELVHVKQARRLPLLWQLSYALLPVPFLFAWFRWRWEREAYLVNLRAHTTTIETVVNTLWSVYGWCWPKPLMRRWFWRQMVGQ